MKAKRFYVMTWINENGIKVYKGRWEETEKKHLAVIYSERDARFYEKYYRCTMEEVLRCEECLVA